MHVAIIIDDERLTHEQAMINRLCVGLMAESVKVTRIVSDAHPPDALDEAERRMALATRLEAPMRVLPWVRGHRNHALALAMERAVPDVLYAIGAQAWALGIGLAHLMNRPVLLDVSASAQVDLVPIGRRAVSVAGYVVPTREIATRLGERVGAELVSVVPMGVAATARRLVTDDGDSEEAREPTMAVLGESRDVAAYRAMLGGLSRVLREQPGLQVIMELHGKHEHEIWRQTDRLGLLNNISTIADFSNYRTLLTGCDIVLAPERFGDLRSVMLEAMGLGAAMVVSSETPLDIFVAGETALFVNHAEADDWSQAVLRLTGDAAERARLGDSARTFVLDRHLSSHQVSGLLGTLERTLSGGAISFAREHARSQSGKN